MPEFQEVWENLDVNYSELTTEEQDYVEWLFEEGFQRYHGEISPADMAWARQEFFDMTGLDDETFDWQGWREAMGYEER
jgi:hypothetical protein